MIGGKILYMNYKEDKEIMDLIKHIKEINKQMVNTDDEIRKVIADTQKSLPFESLTYELASANGDFSQITTLDNISIGILHSKLPGYKMLCENELIKKCGQKLYEKIKEEENI